MRKIIGAAYVSLDGVMQGAGGPNDDPSGGFKYGGWWRPVGDGDEAIGKMQGDGEAHSGHRATRKEMGAGKNWLVSIFLYATTIG
jgi:hypothetical protein